MADMSSGTGCLRKWAYRYRYKIQEPQSDAQKRGDELHSEIAQYLRTGVKQLSSLAMAGLHMLPTPGPDLLVEHDIVPDLPDGSSGLSIAKLRAGGIPLVGAIDLLHTREENPGVTDILQSRDPYPTLKIIDHKSCANLNNAKKPNELVTSLQMAGYAVWAYETFPGLERVRLAHAYYPVRGTPQLVTTLVDREKVERTWNRAHALAVLLKEAAKEPDIDKIDANTRACRAYNKDCPAKSVCKAAMHNSLADFVGVTAADRITASFTPPPLPLKAPDFSMTTPIAPSNLIAHLQAKKAQQDAQIAATQPAPFSFGAPAQNPFANVQTAASPSPAFQVPTAPAVPGVAMFGNPPPAPPVPVGPSPEVLAEMARLEAEAKAAAASPFTAIIQEMDKLASVYVTDPTNGQPVQLGSAHYGGTAAVEVAKVRGVALAGDVIIGTGMLGKHPINDVSILPAALEEMRKMAANAVPAPTPTVANAPVVTTNVVTMPPALLPPDAPASNPLLASKAPEPEKVKEPKKRGRKSNAEKAAAAAAETPAPLSAPTAEEAAVMAMTDKEIAEITEAAMPPGPPVNVTVNVAAPTPVAATPAPAVAASELCFYADCQPDGVPTQSFWPLVNHVLKTLAAEERIADVRLSEGKYGFGKWRGALAAGIRAGFTSGAIPPGHYVLDNASGDIGSTVVDVMKDLIATNGGRFVRGTR